MKNKFLILLLSLVFMQCTSNKDSGKNKKQDILPGSNIIIPSLTVNNESTHDIVKAYRIAIGDIAGNIQYHKSGVLEHKVPCIYAGLLYGKPWTRDAAINVWNGFGLLSPQVSKNTLLAQVEKNQKGVDLITGQYWDKIIWTIGAWNYYLYSGDSDFLQYAFNIIQNTIQKLEKDEFSTELGLFRGPAVYGDGVSAYPEIYSHHQSKGKNGSYSGIYQWAEVNDSLKYPVGYGMPMHTLSTNVVYYRAYILLSEMANELNKEPQNEWRIKAEKLHQSINNHFWNDTKKNYNYLVDALGSSDAQESIGIAFALLFNIANNKQVESIFNTTVVEPAGIPCVYPSFKRYRNDTLDSYGRHSGTVWPHIQGFWADAAMKYNKQDIFMHEFNALTRHAIRDFQFVEIYHPTKEIPYGGIQEPHLKEWTEWFCAERQTWSATAYLRMIFKNILGIHFSNKGITFKPFIPSQINDVSLLGLKYRNSVLDIHISGSGNSIEHFYINGTESNVFFLPKDSKGRINIDIKL